MGLDMYLDKRRYVSGFGGKGEKSEREQLKITGIEGIDTTKVTNIIQEAIYWRKSNAIHNWFVDNVQNGEDDCKDYYVSLEQLQQLLHTVINVLGSTTMIDSQVVNGYSCKAGEKMKPNMEQGKKLKDPTDAQTLLPTSSGFFFGGTDYDQYYWEDLKQTKKNLEELIKSHTDGFEYYYHASW